MVIMPAEVFFADEKVVICVQLPELAVDNIEVFIGEEVHYLVYVLFLFQQLYRLFKHDKSNYITRCQHAQLKEQFPHTTEFAVHRGHITH